MAATYRIVKTNKGYRIDKMCRFLWIWYRSGSLAYYGDFSKDAVIIYSKTLEEAMFHLNKFKNKPKYKEVKEKVIKTVYSEIVAKKE